MKPPPTPDGPHAVTRKEERNTFLFLTVFLAPALAVALVATLGFSIWIWQMIFGPPG